MCRAPCSGHQKESNALPNEELEVWLRRQDTFRIQGHTGQCAMSMVEASARIQTKNGLEEGVSLRAEGRRQAPS